MIDGQEGTELAYDHWLAGAPGAKRVLKDRLGRISTGRREHYAAAPRPRPCAEYRFARSSTLRTANCWPRFNVTKARSGSIVVLDIATGEVLAMVNQPSYNPNNRAGSPVSSFRNRALTDIFEPGSSIKPLVVAAALESGLFNRAYAGGYASRHDSCRQQDASATSAILD